jgi:DNA-binding winged helix-turn-helix (wHTH) protein
MRAYTDCDRLNRTDSAVVAADVRASAPRLARLLNSSTRSGQRRRVIQNTQTSPMRNEVAELLASIDGLPGLVRNLLLDVLAELQSDEIAEGADIRSLLPSTLERMADRMRGSPPRHNAGSAQPRAMVELVPSADSSVRWPATRAGTILRLGALELDLIDRTAKRGDRQIDLRPREFLLLKYMMQRSDKLLTRATLLKEVWHYKFVPETNLVDVHLGRLRRKVDGANEAPMIRNIRGVGFVMSASLPSQGSPPNRAERSTTLPPETSFRSGSKGLCSDYQ